MQIDVKAVIWDFGGLPADTIRRINATDPDSNAWARFERAEIDAAAFDRLFAEEAARIGHDVRGAEILALLSGDVRPAMVAAIDTIKSCGFRTGCITNNVPAGHGAGGHHGPVAPHLALQVGRAH